MVRGRTAGNGVLMLKDVIMKNIKCVCKHILKRIFFESVSLLSGHTLYVVLIIKYVFILKMDCFLSFLRHIVTVYTVVEKVCDIKYCVKIYTALV